MSTKLFVPIDGIKLSSSKRSLAACRTYLQRTLALVWSSFLLSYPVGIVVTGG